MINWQNTDTLPSFKALCALKNRVDIKKALSGENGAERVRTYSVPMAAGLVYNYAAKQVDDTVLSALQSLSDEAQLIDKYEALLSGEIINTGEKRKVLHQLTRGQFMGPVSADGTDKRDFYIRQQQRIADFAG